MKTPKSQSFSGLEKKNTSAALVFSEQWQCAAEIHNEISCKLRFWSGGFGRGKVWTTEQAEIWTWQQWQAGDQGAFKSIEIIFQNNLVLDGPRACQVYDNYQIYMII